MMRAAAENTTPGGKARKAWHSYLYATGACISDCRQVVVALFVVVEACVVGCVVWGA